MDAAVDPHASRRATPRAAPLRGLIAAFTLSAAISSAGALMGCKGDETAAEGAAASDDREEPPANVGYDMRRLRPTDEPLGPRFDRLRAETVKEGKQVAVLFSADWCEPCQVLEIELGNMHPPSVIGDVRIFQIKEEDWEAKTRMDEVNNLRLRWHPTKNSYPVLILLDDEGNKLEEMKEAKARLESEGLQPTLPNWFQSVRVQES